MAVVAVVGAKGAPGATTSVVALACGWPRQVLLADADPAGGDIAAGWLGGRVGLDRGLLSFAAATRHADTAAPADLAPHVAAVRDAPGVLVLPGLAHGGQAGGLDDRLWARLIAASGTPWPPADPKAGAPARSVPVDLLVDCGRISAGTPWPLLASASVVLVATRPTVRGVHHARHALAALQAAASGTVPAGVGDAGRVGLLVCGAGPYDPGEVGRAVGLPVRLVLPADARAADVLSDGVPAGRGWSRTVLARAARTAARRIAAAAHTSAAEPPRPDAVAEERTAAWADQRHLAAQWSVVDGGRR
jgi:hypothetical protein